MTLVTTYRGSVNRWECDENDHQNVRFYLSKLHQGLLIGIAKLGLASAGDAPGLLKCVTSHHIRFLREARVAVPQVIYCGVLNFQPKRSLSLLSLMHNSSNNNLLATFVTEFDLTDNTNSTATAEPDLSFVKAPEDALPKGVRAEVSAYAGLDLTQALAIGFSQVGAGVISAAECGTDGNLESYQIMGRISDGMPNLWALLQTDAQVQAGNDSTIGGAVLEYRLTFHRSVRQGVQFSHLAGIHALGSKTQNICHLVFDATNGDLLVSAEGLGISMDLTSRKSIAIPAGRRERINSLLLQRLN